MATSISDLILQVKDYARSYNIDNARAIRAIDQAVDYVNAEMGLPSQEFEYTFDFDEEQPTYGLPVGFLEPIWMRYQDDELNKNSYFSYLPPEYIYRRINAVTGDTLLWSVGVFSNAPLLYVLAQNSVAPTTLDTFDVNNSSNWVATGDANTISDDRIIFKEGAGSMKFIITVTGTSATLTSSGNDWDLTVYEDVGHFKCWAYLDATLHLTSISFKWGTGVGAYWLQTVTAQADGTAFVIGWNELDFYWQTATEIGAPDFTDITLLQFIYTYTGAYSGGTSFRLDYLRVMKPDTMIMSYYTMYKGKTGAGVYLTKFTATTDTFLFDIFDTGIGNLYAIKAGEIINPQILQDNSETARQYQQYSLMFKRRFPRKRINNLLMNPPTPKTDEG